MFWNIEVYVLNNMAIIILTLCWTERYFIVDKQIALLFTY